ncbi:MAG: hypothetical protein R2800_13325 [Flavipsychrobacter sp.]
MKYLVFLFFVVLSPVISKGQFSKYELSAPIEIPTVGWNKLLQMSNGNTLLFHMEPRIPIVVKVFDSSRKEVSSRRHVTKVVRPRDFERGSFDGLFEVNGEAILFLSAHVDNKETLVRLHFDSKTGALLHEDKVIVSESFQKKALSYVLHHKKADGYAVVTMKNFRDFIDEKTKEQVVLYRFDKNHNQTREMVADLGYKDYDDIGFSGASMASNGSVNMTFKLIKYVEYPNTFNRYLATCFNNKNDTSITIVKAKMNSDLSPYYSQYTYNSFDNYHQVFLVNSLAGYYKHGLSNIAVTHFSNLMSIYSASDLSVSAHKYIENVEATKFYSKYRTEVGVRAELAAKYFFSDNYGNTIIVSEEHADRKQVKIDNRSFSMLGNISVTKVMGNGNESWGVMLPKKQMVPNYLSANTIFYRSRAINIFRTSDPLVEQVNNYASFYSFSSDRELFVVYNDLKQNFSNPIEEQVDTLYDCTTADATYYTIDSKSSIAKFKLYDKEDSTTRAIYIEASDFDDKRKVYAALMLHTIDDENSEMKISWHYK